MALLPHLEPGRIEAGLDEAGRGCLAGPVVAAAVILPEGFENEILNDSKQLSLKKRNHLRAVIEAETTWAVSVVDHTEIDQVNILNASFLAMHRAVDQLHSAPYHLLIDGNRFNPHPKIPHTCIIKGDGKYLSIAAASILAKTHRDEIMGELHEKHPHYQWHKNKGYPTKAHRAAIQKYGSSPYHRQSFKLLPDQLKLKL